MNEIYMAIFTRVDAAIDTAVGDHIPQDEVFPYVQINGLSLTNDDTVVEQGFTGTIDIITWSRYRGRKEVALIMDDIYTTLHHYDLDKSVIYGVRRKYGITTINQAFSQIVTESDGLTRQGIQRFNIIFEELL